MKKLILSSMLLLVAAHAEAKFTVPFGGKIEGAGSALFTSYMNALINRYKQSYPCPAIIYKKTSASVFGGAVVTPTENAIKNVLDDSVTFAVALDNLSAATINDAPDCLLQIPFTLTSLSIIYRLPSEFTAPSNPADWPGHLNISPADLCRIYAGSPTVSWQVLLSRVYNGSQNFPAGNFPVRAFARSDSADETGLLIRYLTCSNQPLSGTCGTFLNALNVTTNNNGPFCGTAPAQWFATNVTCVLGTDNLAQAVKNADNLNGRPNGAIGYVGTDVALTHGFPLPTSGPTGGIPLGIAGLFMQGSTMYTSPQQDPNDNPANYAQPTPTAVQAAMTDCLGGEYLCQTGAYPIVVSPLFVLYATQPVELITCNIGQFIQFALIESPKLSVPGFAQIPSGCVSENLLQLDLLRSAICEPCVEPCNPCLNQTCPLPTCLPCKG